MDAHTINPNMIKMKLNNLKMREECLRRVSGNLGSEWSTKMRPFQVKRVTAEKEAWLCLACRVVSREHEGYEGEVG